MTAAELPRSKLFAFVELGKMRLSSLAIFAVVAGLLLGDNRIPDWRLIAATVAGTVLVAVGGNALNMLLERDTDPEMGRTEARPLPTGRLMPREVFAFGIVCCAVGLACLAVFTNWLATSLCGVIGVTYVLVYTPMKRISTLNTLVGAVPGALPPVVGYTASKGVIDLGAVVLFCILFLWQIPHFLAIAFRYRAEYEKAGLKMLPVMDPDGRRTGTLMMVYCVCLVLVSIWPALEPVGLAGPIYVMAAIALGLLFLVSTFAAAILRRPNAMHQCFLVSIIYLPLLFTAMVVDHLFLMR